MILLMILLMADETADDLLMTAAERLLIAA